MTRLFSLPYYFEIFGRPQTSTPFSSRSSITFGPCPSVPRTTSSTAAGDSASTIRLASARCSSGVSASGARPGTATFALPTPGLLSKSAGPRFTTIRDAERVPWSSFRLTKGAPSRPTTIVTRARPSESNKSKAGRSSPAILNAARTLPAWSRSVTATDLSGAVPINTLVRPFSSRTIKLLVTTSSNDPAIRFRILLMKFIQLERSRRLAGSSGDEPTRLGGFSVK
jgi:hypothetical protein